MGVGGPQRGGGAGHAVTLRACECIPESILAPGGMPGYAPCAQSVRCSGVPRAGGSGGFGYGIGVMQGTALLASIVVCS